MFNLRYHRQTWRQNDYTETTTKKLTERKLKKSVYNWQCNNNNNNNTTRIYRMYGMVQIIDFLTLDTIL